MDGVRTEFDSRSFMLGLTRLEKSQMPWAAAMAVNDTAQEVLDHVRARMNVVFDRPTRFTLNAFQIMPRATKANPEAVVGERPSVSKRHFLKVQETGGPRGRTGVEGLISLRASWAGDIRTVVPATGSPFDAAKLDRHGNWSAGERNQVLSGLGAQRDAAANSTAASRKRAKGRATYFVPKHGLAPGVYRRTRKGGVPVRVLKFSAKVPMYRRRLGFLDGAEDVFRARIGPNLARALARAMKTAR